MKGIFHLHTHYSFDSMTNPRKIVLRAHKMGIDQVIITDHDSLQGSIDAKNFAKSLNLQITIPIAGEFLTDIGDVIAVNVPEDFTPLYKHEELCAKVRSLGGYTVLPHPYDGHKLDKINFDLIDCIEIYNAKSKAENDERSKTLAEKHHKPVIFGADAHFLQDILNSPFEFEGTLPSQHIKQIARVKTSGFRKAFSQMIRGVKQRKLKIFLRSGKRALKCFFCEVPREERMKE